MADNRVVIRVNYDKDKQRKAIIDPKMVTVWHTGRILAAFAILGLILIPLVFWLLNDDIHEDNVRQIENSQASEENGPQSTAGANNKANVANKPLVNKDKQAVVAVRPSAIIFDKRVIRASLTTGVKYNEPADTAGLPLRIEPGRTVELFYFSEVKNMQGKALFHHWLKDGKVVYKKQLDIKDVKSKLISSRTLSDKDKGNWQVLLIDRKGKLFSEASFSVNP